VLRRFNAWMGTREVFAEPPITRTAREFRSRLKIILDGGSPNSNPAE